MYLPYDLSSCFPTVCLFLLYSHACPKMNIKKNYPQLKTDFFSSHHPYLSQSAGYFLPTQSKPAAGYLTILTAAGSINSLNHPQFQLEFKRLSRAKEDICLKQGFKPCLGWTLIKDLGCECKDCCMLHTIHGWE